MKKALLSVISGILFMGYGASARQPDMPAKALLLIDIQNDYFPGGFNELEGADEAAANARVILSAFRDSGFPVVHIQHLSPWPGATFFIPGTPGAEINVSVTPAQGEQVITKNYPNSFRETGLLEYLRAKGITELVVCGMMTHMCVDATVRAAKDYGFNITLIGDACATKDLMLNGITVKAETVHDAFLAALSNYYAAVINAKDFTL